MQTIEINKQLKVKVNQDKLIENKDEQIQFIMFLMQKTYKFLKKYEKSKRKYLIVLFRLPFLFLFLKHSDIIIEITFFLERLEDNDKVFFINEISEKSNITYNDVDLFLFSILISIKRILIEIQSINYGFQSHLPF